MAERNRRCVAVALFAGLLTMSCAHEAGQPRPAVPSSSPTSTATAVGLDDLDLCQVLTPKDLPVESGGRFPTRRDVDPDGTCAWDVNEGDNPLDDFITEVSFVRVPFGRYKPSELAPNGRSTIIANRPAWVGTGLPSGVGTDCEAAFGVADRTIVVLLMDMTPDHPDPCQTVVPLAEIVASRTPPPTE